jgi:O-antigen ligase
LQKPIEYLIEKMTENGNTKYSFPSIIVFALTIFVPLLVLPNLVDNAFRAPKDLLILFGICLLGAHYFCRWLWGKEVPASGASTPYLVCMAVLLNLFSFLYTGNLYFTKIAAILNISCLIFFHAVSLYIDWKKAIWLLAATSFSGVLISLLSYCQFTNNFIIFKGAPIGTMIMGTIGNSNYLGAYLLFPLFSLLGLTFVVKGGWRLLTAICFVIVFGAFLCSRARASWLAFGITAPLFILLLKTIYQASLLKHIRSNPKRALGFAAITVCFVSILWVFAPPRFHALTKFETWSETNTLQYRWKYWRASWHLWLHNDPIFGTGLWSYRNLVYTSQAQINERDPDYFKGYVKPKPRRVHNEYLEILNDGGMVAAFALALLFFTVMRHGWHVIREETEQREVRLVVACAFSSMISMMAAAVFFFPFRVNSTLLMTAMMMGLMEGAYLRNRKLLVGATAQKNPIAGAVVPVVLFFFMGVFLFGGYKTFLGEMEHFKYKHWLSKGNARKAEEHLLQALSLDPRNSFYCLRAGQLYMDSFRDYPRADEYLSRAIADFNGDVTMWGLHYIRGMARLRQRDPFGARAAFIKARYYNPNFEPAHRKLAQVEKLIEKGRNRKKPKKASDLSGLPPKPTFRRHRYSPPNDPVTRF